MKKRLLAPSVGILSVGVLSLATMPALSQEDNSSYREGYQLILEQQWQQARDHFSDFQQQYNDSAWADDAAFWNCYANEQMNTEEREHFECYRQFMTDWPQSSWTSDARGKLLVLGSSLAARGNPEFLEQLEFMSVGDPDVDFDFDFDFDEDVGDSVARALDRAEREMERVRVFRENMNMSDLVPPLPPGVIIDPDGDIDIDLDDVDIDREEIREAVENARRVAERMRETYGDRSRMRRRSSVDDELLTVLAALRHDERASEILIERLETSDDSRLRSRIVLLLEDIPGDAVTNRLLELVDSDPSEEVRTNAIIVLLDRESPAARDRLLEIARDASYPVAVRAEIIDELDDWETQQTLPLLEELLAGSEPALIEEAADALADIESEESIALLLTGFNNQADPVLRYVILEEITDVETPAILNFLSDLALESDDDELAAIAIEGLADREDNIGISALEHIYLNTENLQRRLAAMHGIGEAENAQSLTVITQLIDGEINPTLLAAAASALGESEQEGAVPVLMSLYNNSSDSALQRSVIRALRRLDDYPAATEAMLDILEDRLNETANQ